MEEQDAVMQEEAPFVPEREEKAFVPEKPKKPTVASQAIRANKPNLETQTRELFSRSKKVKVRIASTDTDRTDVIVQINGVNFQIRRDSEVEIPVQVYNFLSAQKNDVYSPQKRSDGEGMEMIKREVPRFSISVVL